MPQVVAAVKVVALAVEAFAATHAAFVFAAKVVLVAGGYAYQRQQQKKALRGLAGGSSNLDSGRLLTVKEAAGTRKLIYGQMRVGGTLVYAHVTGTNKEYLHLLIAHAAHEVEEIGDIYINDEIVPLDGSGNATGRYAGYVTVKKHLGADAQTVDTDLQTAVGAGTWTNNHRLRGIAYTYVKLTHNPDLFPSGLPNVSAVLKGFKLYDPRTSTTVYSANPALCLRHYLLLSQDRGGLGADSAEIDDAAVQAAANVCDEAVNLNPSGTELRYTAHGVVDTSAEPGVVITGLCAAMAGICPYVGGVFKMKAGAHTASVLTLGEDDVRGRVSFSTRDSLRNAFNGVKGTYVSSKTDYQPADFPPVVNASYTTEDGGNRIWRDLALGFTTSSSMAQRLAKIELERSRQDITINLKTSLLPIEAHVGDVVAVTLARYGFSAKLFEVVNCRFYVEGEEAPVLGLEWTLRETASGVWDWALGEETTVDLAPNTTLVDPFSVATPSAPTLSTSNFVQADGTISPRLKVAWSAPADTKVTSGGYVHIEFKKNVDSTWIVWTSTLRGNATEDYINDVQSGVSYDVRMRFENVHGVRGSYSSTATYTVTNDTTAPGTPSGLAATAKSGGIALAWSDNTEDDLSHYDVYRNTVNTFGSATLVNSTRAANWTDFLVTPSTTYYYWLKAVDRTGNSSSETSSVNAVPLGAGASVAAGTGSFSTIGLNAGSQSTALTVSKTPVGSSCSIIANCTMENLDTVADSGVVARVYRDSTVIGVFLGFNLTSLETEAAPALVIADTGLTPGTTYSYTIKCYRTVSGATVDCQSCSLAITG